MSYYTIVPWIRPTHWRKVLITPSVKKDLNLSTIEKAVPKLYYESKVFNQKMGENIVETTYTVYNNDYRGRCYGVNEFIINQHWEEEFIKRMKSDKRVKEIENMLKRRE